VKLINWTEDKSSLILSLEIQNCFSTKSLNESALTSKEST
jgi:hypothetical protein